jgi:predicted kinase
LLSELDAFGLGKDVIRAAARALSNPESRKRLVKFAEKVQIPFEVLECADICLFD